MTIKAVILSSKKVSFSFDDKKGGKRNVQGENVIFWDLERQCVWRKFIGSNYLKGLDIMNYVSDFLNGKIFLVEFEADVSLDMNGKEKVKIVGDKALSKGR